MCESYVASCEEQECIDKADPYDVFHMRSGRKLFLWRGYDEPCEHIKRDWPYWEEDMKDF